jgi:protein-S-isoprenylcysteine O-methyltransferase Ste14
MGAYEHPQVSVAPPLLFLGALVVAIGLHLLVPLPAPSPGTMRSVAMMVLVGGFLLAAWAFTRLVKAGTSPDPHRAATTLLTGGPYHFTRNPIYLGFALVFLGFTILAGTLWGVVLLPIVILVVTRYVIQPEEQHLRARFDQHYEAYSARVRRWL